MEPLTVIGIAVGLAMDAFAVAIATSVTLRTVSGRQYFRLSFHFGFFQFMMPLAGWLLGTGFASYMADYDHWVAFGLLGFIGGRMIHGALAGRAPEPAAPRGGDGDGPAGPVSGRTGRPNDPTRGWSLVLLSVATSIDALAVGVSFAMLDHRVFLPCVAIGVITAGITLLGMRIGGRLGVRFGCRMEIVGGLILVGIGTRILVQHLAV
ncbi:MAG: manganese efflux pump [Acidobacteria bacterium]|nr:manganese efflux pump [Acidobacteriota bacterium]